MSTMFSGQHLESNRDYILNSVYCNTEFWSSSSDKLSGYIKAQAFSILDSLFFYLRLNSSGLRLLIFHKMSEPFFVTKSLSISSGLQSTL